MLLIIMHKKQRYLEEVLSLIKKEGIPAAAVAGDRVIGAAVHGNLWDNVIFNHGGPVSEYNKAVIALISDTGKARRIADTLKYDSSLKWSNLNSESFMCAVPFQGVKELEKVLSGLK